jgi:protein Mpv17
VSQRCAGAINSVALGLSAATHVRGLTLNIILSKEVAQNSTQQCFAHTDKTFFRTHRQNRCAKNIIKSRTQRFPSHNDNNGNITKAATMMMNTQRIVAIALCWNAILPDAMAFSLPLQPPRRNTNRNGSFSTTTSRTRPLKAFDVMTTVEAGGVVGSGAITAAASTLSTSIGSTINAFFQNDPYLAAFLTCSFKASAADIVAQNQEDLGGEEEANEFSNSNSNPLVVVDDNYDDNNNLSGVNLSRNLGFLLYGGLYQGMAQCYLYNVVYPALLGTATEAGDWTLIAKQVLVDNLLFAPLLCLPLAYCFKAAFTSDNIMEEEWDILFQSSLTKYVDDVRHKGLLTKYWSLWIPVQCLTFGVIPPQFRVAFVGFVSFFWICILSTVVSSSSSTTTISSSNEEELQRSASTDRI